MLSTMGGLLSVVATIATATIGMCPGPDDVLVSVESIVERNPCQASGYCWAQDYNPMTGRYEYYYGYHTNCPGEETRIVTYKTYQRPDQSRCQAVDAGPWRMCEIR